MCSSNKLSGYVESTSSTQPIQDDVSYLLSCQQVANVWNISSISLKLWNLKIPEGRNGDIAWSYRVISYKYTMQGVSTSGLES